VLAAIELDHKPQRRRVEIENEIAGWVLPPKIYAKLSIAQLLPKSHFDFRIIATKILCACCFRRRPIKAIG
jgi:hypothetical protein